MRSGVLACSGGARGCGGADDLAGSIRNIRSGDGAMSEDTKALRAEALWLADFHRLSGAKGGEDG